jgi:hypothetical protein
MVPPRSEHAAAALEPTQHERATSSDATRDELAHAADLALARRALAGHRHAEALMRRLATEIDLPQIALPRLRAARVGRGALDALGEAIARGLDAAAEARS